MTFRKRAGGAVGLGTACIGLLLGGAARAQNAPAQQPAQQPAAQPAPAAAEAAPTPAATWQSSIKLSAQIEGGVSFNPAGPSTNFGQLLTDHANQAQLNQVLLTAERDIDTKNTGWDVGFKFQALYGSDGRYTQYLGEFNRVSTNRYQFEILEANATIHIPLLTEGGTDLKFGQFTSPLGTETIEPSANPFYSHSYIFNFGVPFVQTGGYATIHATPFLDVYLGGDTGVNTTFGGGDNNSAGAVMFGFGLNLLDGNLTVLALSHIGPENPSLTVPNANHFKRYLNDAYAIYKPTDKLTLTTELNYIRDDFAHADGYGAAQYASYALTDQLRLNGRAEVWRDNKGFYVTAFPGNRDFINAEAGLPATVISAPQTTYGELTVGVTYKPAGLPAPISGLLIRPELRYDHSLNGTKPFNSGKDPGSFTIASDFVLTF
ncbi:MAG TPA: outer membrane beta-barrel protein [Acetobacteraceae bacterium]|jgi:hypothetical protein|nr:outer membrane beta-barrel protein [Acetobacteraceae bacterium]